MFAQPKVIIYIRRNDIIITGKKVATAKLAIPTDVVSNLEVLDPARFISMCQSFFSSHKLRGQQLLLILDQGIVFDKSIVLGDADNDSIQTLAAAYVAAIPFDAGKRACLQLREGKQLELYATNAELYTCVVEALRQSGFKNVVAITPASAYKLDNSVKPAAALELYATNKDVYRVADFSTVEPS